MTQIPLGLHESTISRHYAKVPGKPGEVIEDDVLEGMCGAMTKAREAAEAALDANRKIMGNQMATQLANMRNARNVTFQHFETAAKKLDAARARAVAIIEMVEADTHSPPEPKHISASMVEAEVLSLIHI